eukprot:TRINITY_DN11622_c0_g1_i1.p1 TRINITY_DN11622_c0_g1~~TRINITY_DN11622_c0_g1_i1.p1  ORF type:complete len:169 (-),score=23.92 TRINITY_DN11622_c0_g1_i1:175-681(-)
MWGALDKFGKILAILVICFAVVFLLLTIPYYVAISDANARNVLNVTDCILWVISILLLCCVAGCGFVGSFKEMERCLLVFAMANIVLWVFGLIQMVIIYITEENCYDRPLFEGNPFDNMCEQDLDDLWYWIPNIILMFVNACAAFAACGMRHKVMETTNDAGLGEFFG